MTNTRVRDIIEKKQDQSQPADDRAQRFAVNAAKHLAAKSAPWQNPDKWRQHLTNAFDASPVELESVAELLESGVYFSAEDRESGVAPQIALAMVRNE